MALSLIKIPRSGGGGGGLTSVATEDSATVSWAGDGTALNPLIATATVAATSPAGSNTQVQYNNSGVFGAEAAFTYNPTTDLLSVPKASLSRTLANGEQI